MIKHSDILAMALGLAMTLTMTMCTASVPDADRTVADMPKIAPDYTGLTIPCNIAPLNFCISEAADAYVTHIHNARGTEIVTAGRIVDIDVDAWHKLLEESKGDSITIDVYARAGGLWTRYAPIRHLVAEEIDSYVSYRHIEPLYVNYEVLRICQRDLTNFEVTDLYNNCGSVDIEGNRQCINCHSYQNYNADGNMQMHIRVIDPGTLIVKDGKCTKVNLKVGEAYGPGAYCSWHPSLPYIAYSINDTWQHFHSMDPNKVEVQDGASDLILYDIDNNEVSMVADSKTELETFPYWSPDGKYLYYVSATVPPLSPERMADYRRNEYKNIKYNIYKKPFDAATRTFGPTDTVFMASEYGHSATFPRETPDGRYLLFTMGEYGTFHNFHHDADLYLMDLRTGDFRALDEVNSDDTESYHSWSSNGRWIVFSSRRDNGSYTRLYIAYFDGEGHAGKPFILPQRSPFADDLLFKSYNLPELMSRPVELSRREFINAISQPAIDAKFR